MKRILEVIVRLAVLSIFLYLETEAFNNISNLDMISSIGTLLVVFAPFWIKVQDEQVYTNAHSSLEYLLPSENIFLAVLLIMIAMSVNALENDVIVVVIGLFLIAILQIFDSIFLKNLKRRLNV